MSRRPNDAGAHRARRQVYLDAATWAALRSTGNASVAIETLVRDAQREDHDGMDGGMDAATVRALRAERAVTP